MRWQDYIEIYPPPGEGMVEDGIRYWRDRRNFIVKWWHRRKRYDPLGEAMSACLNTPRRVS